MPRITINEGESVRLANPLARFGKVVRTATNQKVGSSSPPRRTIFIISMLFDCHNQFEFNLHFLLVFTWVVPGDIQRRLEAQQVEPLRSWIRQKAGRQRRQIAAARQLRKSGRRPSDNRNPCGSWLTSSACFRFNFGSIQGRISGAFPCRRY